MARKHECPDCGASHEMSADGRIQKLEERVKELEADRDAHRCDHHGCIHYWWNTQPIYHPWTVTTSTWQPDQTTTTWYNSISNTPQITSS